MEVGGVSMESKHKANFLQSTSYIQVLKHSIELVKNLKYTNFRTRNKEVNYYIFVLTHN